MGSVSPHSSPQSLLENSSNNFRIYVAFSRRDSSLRSNVSNWIECYNPSNNLWQKVSVIPGLIDNHMLKGFSMVSISDSIYIIGGKLVLKIIGSDPDNTITTDVDMKVVSCVLRYDTKNDVWSKCASLRVPRFDFACTVCNNKIYVAGGQSTLGSARGISSAEVYDPALDEWQTLPNMSAMRYKCVGVTWQEKIHVVGGFAERDDPRLTPWNTKERSSAEVYDSSNSKWDLMLGMWQLDVPPNQIVVVDDKLFSSGDCLNAWKGHIEAYDGKLNIWNVVDGSQLQALASPISNMSQTYWPPTPQLRLYLTMVPIGTHLYFLAGYKKSEDYYKSTSIVHIFDTSANKDGWTSLEPIEEECEKELCSHCCVVK
ncbi:kelch-like protein 5 [Carica papaya]|uniref:kelch-like protein 5 n=1 Tax=Carica papaya TaxID=3649 RepID=UPI000B8CDED2|nr:kelch-like protein 5 [Carica papaya]